MNSPRDLYINSVRRALPRLFSLLDRNPASPTFGCFDRSYWLHRKTDFASSTAQLSLRTLCLLYANDFGIEDTFKNAALKTWIEGAFRFTLKIQHRDGSFDEWYPNERGWAGPTGYVAHALFESYQLVKNHLDHELQSAVECGLLAAARFLADRDETEVLANHYAIALVPLAEIANAFHDDELKSAALRLLNQLRATCTEEGWALEYDGCDIGYGLGTLNFLAEGFAQLDQEWILDWARKSFTFLSHFAYPDGGWAGALGSRHTIHSYPFALEFWSERVPEARALLRHFRSALCDHIALDPADQEDHYIHYRLAEYLKAAMNVFSGNIQNELLPYENENFASQDFPLAGYQIEKKGDVVSWFSRRRGGAVRVYSLRNRKVLLANDGVLFTDTANSVLTSLWQTSALPNKSLARWQAGGALYPMFVKRFSPFTFLLFRTALLFLIFPRLAEMMKLLIRKTMITHRRENPSRWSRKIEWDERRMTIEDEIQWREPRDWKQFHLGGEFHTRYVPQAQYFTALELKFPPHRFIPEDFKNHIRLKCRTEIDFTSGKIETCAQ